MQCAVVLLGAICASADIAHRELFGFTVNSVPESDRGLPAEMPETRTQAPAPAAPLFPAPTPAPLVVQRPVPVPVPVPAPAPMLQKVAAVPAPAPAGNPKRLGGFILLLVLATLCFVGIFGTLSFFCWQQGCYGEDDPEDSQKVFHLSLCLIITFAAVAAGGGWYLIQTHKTQLGLNAAPAATAPATQAKFSVCSGADCGTIQYDMNPMSMTTVAACIAVVASVLGLAAWRLRSRRRSQPAHELLEVDTEAELAI